MPKTDEDVPRPEALRDRVLQAAARLVAEGGLGGLTTRAVAAAAGVQGPTLYRLFGDKRGLLDALAEHGIAAFVAGKAAAGPHGDPVQDLRDAWDGFVAFGLEHPAVFALMNEVGAGQGRSPAAQRGLSVLEARVRRIALAGRLGVAEPLAVAMIHAAGVGVVTSLLTSPPAQRHATLSHSALDAVLGAVLTGPAEPRRREDAVTTLAVSLGARIGDAPGLTPGERLLLAELLARLAG